MKIAVFNIKQGFSANLYIFNENVLEGLFFISGEEFKASKFPQMMRGVDKVYVLLDDPDGYYLNLLKLPGPGLRAGELKKIINYELVSILGEKARFAFEVIATKEDETGISSLVLVNGIKESYFNEMVEYLRNYRDLIELVVSYPISYYNYDLGRGTLILELYEDKTKMTVLMGGVVILYRTLPVGSQTTDTEGLVLRLRDEIERITYYVRQNYDRTFEVKKMYYFTEDRSFTRLLSGIKIESEAIELPLYRGGDLAPYIVAQKSPKEFILNILPPIVSYKEISPFIYLFLLLSFLIYSGLFSYSYFRLLKYERSLSKALENLKTGVYQNLSYIRENRMWMLTSGLSQADVPLGDFLKAVSASLGRGMRLTYLKMERQASSFAFSLTIDFDNVPDFKKVDLLKSFTERLGSYGIFQNLVYEVQSRGDKREYRVKGVILRGDS
ncbi:MAG: hypothetical protein QMD82_07485 [bacterium]|nr:hypothetical protein [bacterium]